MAITSHSPHEDRGKGDKVPMEMRGKSQCITLRMTEGHKIHTLAFTVYTNIQADTHRRNIAKVAILSTRHSGKSFSLEGT